MRQTVFLTTLNPGPFGGLGGRNMRAIIPAWRRYTMG